MKNEICCSEYMQARIGSDTVVVSCAAVSERRTCPSSISPLVQDTQHHVLRA